jgi:hypothetical protein
MRRRPIPFRFKVLRPEPDREHIYLPKLGEADVDALVARLDGLGFGEPKVINVGPKVLKFSKESATLRLMPRGLLIGSNGTFERLGPSLDIKLRHEPAGREALSWSDNDYQTVVPTQGGLTLHVRGRHTPSPRHFAAEVSRTGSLLSPDEALMVLATVEACNPETVELLATSSGTSVDLSQPLHLEGKGFLHHVELAREGLLSKADDLIEQCLGQTCPFTPLPDSTIRLKGASLPPSPRGLEEVMSILENWVSGRSYFGPTLPKS